MKALHSLTMVLGTVALAVSVVPVAALCSDGPWAISSFYAGNSPYYSYVLNPVIGPGNGVNGSRLGPNTRGVFWSLGAGNAAIDAPVGGGDDSGSWPAIENGLFGGTGWMISGCIPCGAQINSTWAADPRVNGCVNTPAQDCTVVLLSDHDGTEAYFAVVSGAEDSLGNYNLAQPNSAPIQLAEIPRPRITGQARVNNDSNITLAPPLPSALAPGKYLAPCGAGAITGYRLYERVVLRGAPVGAGRDPAQWTPRVIVPITQSTTLFVDCSEQMNQDIYLAQTLVTDGGFETAWVSGTSLRVECGPQLAEPDPVGRPETPNNYRFPIRRGHG